MARVKDVFVAGGMPTQTYVDRSGLKLENKLRSELSEGFKILCITGPTKCGKTVLCRKVLGSEKSVWMSSGIIKSIDDFWSDLLRQLGLASETVVTSGRVDNAGLRALVDIGKRVEAGTQKTFDTKTKFDIINCLLDRGSVLVVDDFHFLSAALQQEVIRGLKSAVFEGLRVIFLAVPHRAFDVISREREMEGRFSHIEIPKWNLKELSEIANTGFPLVNVKVPAETIERLASESIGSPLLMQRYCHKICTHYDIETTLPERRELNPSNRVIVGIFEKVANDFGYPAFKRLSTGPQSRSARVQRQLRSGERSIDIYEAILNSIASTGPKEQISYNEIREQLQHLLVDGAVPQKNQINSALTHMARIAKEEIGGEPIIEWTDDVLYITDPFLIFFLRWVINRGQQKHSDLAKSKSNVSSTPVDMNELRLQTEVIRQILEQLRGEGSRK